ncbi:MAG: UDP-glucose/GDP-mannose dehydrogenase family protein [Actinobacteria bacterium]|nr:UDP-glucose/GDP-mannose dehydrogenase family protein [Actinomycetota bacterium]
MAGNRADSNMSVIGLGKLGAPFAACLASMGFRVIGVDVNPQVVEAVMAAKAPVFEPGLQELMARYRDNITATAAITPAVHNSVITFIVVATPSDERGAFSLGYVLSACASVGEALSSLDRYHLVVITSTVLPGSTGGPIKDVLEERSGKTCGKDFGLCYNPEFIALGSVIRNTLNPDFVLVGESDARAGEMLEGVYRELCDNDPPIARMNIINAEITKLAVNTYVTTKISFANMLARICEHMPGADVDVVTGALGKDARIGPKYLKGALGYGGPCFPRDNQALSFIAREVGASATLADATDMVNRAQVENLASVVMEHLPPGGKVGILGLTYKPDTNVVEESQGVLLAGRLEEEGIRCFAYDPAARIEDVAKEFDGFSGISSLEECVRQADVIIITTPWDEFKTIDPALFAQGGRRRVVIDCWRILDPEEVGIHAAYHALGIGYLDDI